MARLAGVSKSTVSNVIRGANGVSRETERLVLEAVERLGYRPNAIARQFVRQRTTILGVLVGDLDNPFYAQMAKLVEREALRADYATMFCNVEGDDGLAVSGVETMLEQRVAGIVFLAAFGRTPRIEELLSSGVPVVLVGLTEPWADSVAGDDQAGGRLAVEHLIELGHERIAYLTTPSVEDDAARARQRGYATAMRRVGLKPEPAIRWDPARGSDRVGGNRADLEAQLLGPGGPTAVFCSNDLGAIALLELLDGHVRRVPEDMSVVGFDNVGLAELARISLTTVAQPLDELAQRGVETLLRRVDGSLTGGPHRTTIPVSLVVRGSTAAPRT